MQAVILAAGRGTRMKETIPKVLVTVENKPMLQRTFDALQTNSIDEVIVVVGNNYPQVYQLLGDQVIYARQAVPLGTMDAVVKAMPYLRCQGYTIIVPADIPYLEKYLIEEIINYYSQDEKVPLVVGMRVKCPDGYGRIIQHHDDVTQIVEEKDATFEQLSINVVNTSIYIIPNNLLFEHYHEVRESFITGEYYLTNFINILTKYTRVRLLIYPECYTLKGANDINSLKKIIKQKNDTLKQIK